MYQLFLGCLLAFFASSTHAQTWLAEPQVRVCVRFSCSDGSHAQLTGNDMEYVKSLSKGIAAGAKELDVTKYFGWGPVRRSPESQGAIGDWQGSLQRLTWQTERTSEFTGGPHVDVYFIAGRVFMLKWWSNGIEKMVQLSFAE